MSADQSRPAGPGADEAARMRSRRIWVPALWVVYGAGYVAVFIGRGQQIVAAAAGVIVIVIGAGLAVELRRPQASERRLLGWEHDERHKLIHLYAAAFTGYVAAIAALVAGFVEFALGHASVVWPMNILGGLILAYGVGMAIYSHRR